MSGLYDFGTEKATNICSNDELQLLNSCTIKTPKWTFEGHTVYAKCVKVYDGDSATFAFIPPGSSSPFKFSCRCLGYNSAELRTKDQNEKNAAIRSRDFLKSLIFEKIVQLKLGPHDKYGRVLIDIYLNDLHINHEMVRLGYGKPYDGTGPKLY